MVLEIKIKYLQNIEVWQLSDLMNNDNYEHLQNIKKLKILDLYFDEKKKISDENIKNINIEHITLSDLNNITINGLNKYTKKIDIYGNVNIKDEDLKNQI